MNIRELQSKYGLSLTDALEAYYILDGKEVADAEKLQKSIRNSYAKSKFPAAFIAEKGDDVSITLEAEKEIMVGIKAPDAYFLSEALYALHDNDSGNIRKDLQGKIMSVVYHLLDSGENFSTVRWAPQEFLDSVFGGNLSQDDWRATYISLIKMYVERFLEVCSDMKDNTESKSIKSSREDVQYYREKKENNKENAKFVGKTAARVGLVASTHFFGTYIMMGLVIVIGVGLLSLFVGVAVAHSLLLSVTGAITLISSAIFAYQTYVKVGDRLKEFALSFLIAVMFAVISFISLVGCVLEYIGGLF